jgi:diadenosine tetraphosphate (Ap4A) HIT family hydrolase
MENRDRVAEKVNDVKVKKEKGYLYYVDDDGDVARVPAKWNKYPEFLENMEKVQRKNIPADAEVRQLPEGMRISALEKQFMDMKKEHVELKDEIKGKDDDVDDEYENNDAPDINISTNITNNTLNNNVKNNTNIKNTFNNNNPNASNAINANNAIPSKSTPKIEAPVSAPESHEPVDPNVVYSDKVCVAKIADRALNAGHLRIIAKKKDSLKSVNEDELIHMFTISSFSASVLFETLKAQGTNIILNQKNGLELSVVPRFENDGIELMWEMKQGDPQKIQAAAAKIKDKLIIGEVKDFSKVDLDKETDEVMKTMPPEDAVPEGQIDVNKKVNIVNPISKSTPEKPKKNYLFDALRRIP